jgi:Leucine-rich repeat (LRR) protein
MKDLVGIHIDGLLSEIPDTICNLKSLKYLAIPNNKQLKTLPACLSTLDSLKLINVKGCDNLQVPEELRTKVKMWGG